ncbi:metal-dependent hydrolase [Cristinia sonorae]|uniref:Metal-dependent hydrolase n=1 Tax=Cristinia sonorae TaxID=1940300 RepID=A0A8K0UKY2_9AGAR|nr:metal-dependent hydrolase [Cristinia sonorae]
MLQWQRAYEFDQALQQKAVPPSHNKWRAADAFRLATLGGAEALNMSHLIGTIEEGKKADLLVFDAESPNLAACLDPFLGFVFHASDADIELVMVNGEIVKQHGKLVNFKWSEVAKELKEASKGIHERWPAEKLERIWSDYYAKKGGPQ